MTKARRAQSGRGRAEVGDVLAGGGGRLPARGKARRNTRALSYRLPPWAPPSWGGWGGGSAPAPFCAHAQWGGVCGAGLGSACPTLPGRAAGYGVRWSCGCWMLLRCEGTL